jgi:hypothetical protein
LFKRNQLLIYPVESNKSPTRRGKKAMLQRDIFRENLLKQTQ